MNNGGRKIFEEEMQIEKEKERKKKIKYSCVWRHKFELVNGGIIRRSGKLSNRDKER